MDPAADNPILLHPWLAPLHLPGGHVLPNRIVPGPMEGVTAGSFVTELSRLGLVRCWITPFMRVSVGVPALSRIRARLEEFRNANLPVIVQLMGTSIPGLRDTAARVVEAGVAGIDLNCACPSRTVMGNGAGGGRLYWPEWIAEALAALRSACPDCGISVKLRTGVESPEEMEHILPPIRDVRPDFAIVHFRTVREQYRRVPDGVERLRRARELLGDVPMIASGDIYEPDEALLLAAATGCAGVAPARGILRNPAILREIEAACAGLPPPDGLPGPARVLAGIVETAARDGSYRKGFALHLAGHMFGRASGLFRELAATQTPSAFLSALARASG